MSSFLSYDLSCERYEIKVLMTLTLRSASIERMLLVKRLIMIAINFSLYTNLRVGS
jgi:hypothetical protein